MPRSWSGFHQRNNDKMGRETYDGRALENRANDPEKSSKDDGLFATNLVTKVGDRKGTK